MSFDAPCHANAPRLIVSMHVHQNPCQQQSANAAGTCSSAACRCRVAHDMLMSVTSCVLPSMLVGEPHASAGTALHCASGSTGSVLPGRVHIVSNAPRTSTTAFSEAAARKEGMVSRPRGMLVQESELRNAHQATHTGALWADRRCMGERSCRGRAAALGCAGPPEQHVAALAQRRGQPSDAPQHAGRRALDAAASACLSACAAGARGLQGGRGGREGVGQDGEELADRLVVVATRGPVVADGRKAALPSTADTTAAVHQHCQCVL